MSKIAIIDMDSLLFAAFHGNKVLDEKGIPTRTEDNSKFIYNEKTAIEIMDSCDYLMNQLLDKSEATGYIGFVKGRNTTKSKEAVNDAYKADRNKESPKLWNFTKEYLKLDWGIVEVDNIETDDAVNIARLRIPDSFICAIDSDLLGLEGKHYNWKKNEWITTSKEEADFKFWSDMMCGTHNNTKGIPKIGPKGASILLSNVNDTETYLSLTMDAFIDHFGEYEGIKQFYINYACTKILTDYEGFIIPEIKERDKLVQDSF